VVLTIAVAIVGAAAWRRPRLGIAACVVLGAIGAAAAVTRPANDLIDAIPSIVGAAAGVSTYRMLRQAAGLPTATGDDESPVSMRGYDRRRFLQAGIAAAGVTVVAGGLGRLLTSRATAADSRAAAHIPPPAVAGPPTPAGADLGVTGVSPFLTPNPDFYRVDTALFVPAIDAETWTLRVHGMVDRELTLDFSELLSRPMIERDVTIACVSNEVGGRYVGNARWIGAPLADILYEAGVRSGADQLVARSADGFTVGTPTAALLDGRDAMLAVAMNGEALPLEHGFPVRMVIPGLYGYESACKWITEIEATTYEAYSAYWVRRGWAEQVLIKTGSRIDTPRNGASPAAGLVAVAGVAWAQHRGISAVEIQIDDGAWSPARLATQDTVDTWRQWVFDWDTTVGAHRITVRATDGDGQVQTDAIATPFPSGATGLHSIAVNVR
jgi:DMSO/TMAO reductase YedYZ molybdopterin-dependent catalytic subunit